jgi:hypothetical protein
MVMMNRAVASITVCTAAFFALSGTGGAIDPVAVLLASGAVATLTLVLFATRARRGQAEARERARGLALADAEGLMRLDTDKG